MFKIDIKYFLAFLFFVVFGLATAQAQQLVYTPKNPAFGGNPLNYSWMLSSAGSQNQYEGSRASAGFQRDPLADFESSLQRQVLSQLTRDIINNQFGEGGVAEESIFEFGEFSISVSPGIDGVSIIIQNILTGDETSITIPNF